MALLRLRLTTRLALIALIAIVPVLGIMVFDQSTDRHHARDRAVENAARLAQLAAGRQASVFGDVQQLLATLVTLPTLREADPVACRTLLDSVRRGHPDYINLWVVNADGSPFCAAITPAFVRGGPTSAKDAVWFTRVIRTRTAAIGEYQISLTNHRPDVVVAEPLLSPSGQIERIVAAAVGLDQLNATFATTPLPRGATLTLTDRRGTILARTPDAASWIGRRRQLLSPLVPNASGTSQSLSEGVGDDGIVRLYSVVPVDANLDTGLSVTMDIEASAVFAESDQLLRQHLWLLGFVALTAIAIALLGGRLLVSRPVDAMKVERDEAELSRRETEDRMRFALEASRLGVWEANLMTGVAFWDPASEAMHGLARGTFGGSFTAFLNCIHADDRAQVADSIAKAIREHQNAEVEYRTLWPDGSERWIRSTCQFFYDADGVPLRGAGVALDVTDRRSLEDQFRQAQKMEAVGQLAGGVAHDFNNMLTAILGSAEFLLHDLAKDDVRRGDVEEIAKAGQRAATLTHQLLAFSRKQILSPKVLHLGDVVAGMTPMLRRLLGESVDLRAAMSDHDHVKADAGQIEQVIMNLAVNARDAMKAGGRLTIETADVTLDDTYASKHTMVRPGPYVMVAVSDTGCGMNALTQKRIFEPFFTTKPTGQGTGLGLATVYGIVKQSGGHIGVYSEVGHGTSFKIYLPRTGDVPDAPRPAAALASAPRGSERILVVEDEEVVRQFVTKVLTRQGYQVHAVETPDLAIEFAAAHGEGIDLVLTDVVLPDMSGPEMVQRLPAHPGANVLYMSGYTDEAITHRGVLDPGTCFLHKPFTSSALAKSVREALDQCPLTVAAS